MQRILIVFWDVLMLQSLYTISSFVFYGFINDCDLMMAIFLFVNISGECRNNFYIISPYSLIWSWLCLITPKNFVQKLMTNIQRLGIKSPIS